MNEIKAGVIVAAKLPISESTRKRNPKLFGPLGGLEAQKPEPTLTSPLDDSSKKRQRRPHRLGIVVNLIAIRRRPLDDDNNIGSLKPLRDSIARTLNLDDADSRLRWEYGQQQTQGREGVIVKIESAGAATQE